MNHKIGSFTMRIKYEPPELTWAERKIFKMETINGKRLKVWLREGEENPPEPPKYEIIFEVDENGILTVTAQHIATKESVNIRITSDELNLTEL